MRTYCFIDGAAILVRWGEPQLGEDLEHIFRYLGLRFAHSASTAAQVRLDLSASAPPLELPPNATEVARYESGITAWRAGTRIFLSDGASAVQVDPASGRARGTLAPLLQENGPVRFMKLIALFVLSLFILLRRRQYYPLHGGALVRDGQGLLLVADSGSGKSTLSYSLVRQGWHYLSDDSVLLRPRGAHVEALAFRRNFGLCPEARHHFPEITSVGSPQLTDTRKQSVPLERLYPSQAAGHCIPAVILFPRIADQPESELSEVKPSKALLNLISQSALVTLEPGQTAQHLDVLKRLIHQTRPYKLQAGHDLRDDPSLIGPLLERILPARPVSASV